VSENAALDAADVVRDFAPAWGLVLGSGLGALVENLTPVAEIPFASVSGMPVSRVPGHAGRFVLAEIGGERIVIAAGRVHLYEGWTAAEVCSGVRWMAAAGISQLLLTNAAGSLNPQFAPGSWMMLSDHLNLTGVSPLTGAANFLDMAEAYSPRLGVRFSRAAIRAGIALHSGVYAALAGPQYETPAEVRMLRMLGADAVGMSTVLEVIQARALGLEVAAFSCITNWAAGLGQGGLDHAEVLATGRQACSAFECLLALVLQNPDL
jgi:purine-nucleoside phosphorylase